MLLKEISPVISLDMQCYHSLMLEYLPIVSNLRTEAEYATVLQLKICQYRNFKAVFYIHFTLFLPLS